MTRYEILADTLASEIASGRLPVGARLPSVRHLTTQYGVGQSTVFRAYYLLEERGLIRARERSGYFVAPGASAPPQPCSLYALEPLEIDTSKLVFSVLDSVRHPDIVPLGSAFPSPQLFPHHRLAKSLAYATRMLDPWSSVHDMPLGNEHLRRQIGLRYLVMGFPQPVEEILITNGAMEALNLCLMAVTSPGDVVAIESPCFYAASQAIERLGLRAVEIPVHPCTGLDLDALSEALERRSIRACWFMTNFHNPTGATLSLEKKKALVALLSKHEVPLIEDDVYGELHFGAQRPLPAKAFDTAGLVMHCSSLSKTLCPGYRLGWVAAGRYTDKLRKLKLMTSIATSTPIQAGIGNYLQCGGFDRHLRKLRTTLHAQLISMEEAIADNFPVEVEYHRPAGGYFLWLKLPLHIDTVCLHRMALESGISIAPGPIFTSTNKYRNYIRINYGHPWNDKFEAAMQTLGKMIGGMSADFPGSQRIAAPLQDAAEWSARPAVQLNGTS